MRIVIVSSDPDHAARGAELPETSTPVDERIRTEFCQNFGDASIEKAMQVVSWI